MDFALPVDDHSVDRIFAASVFTHLFEPEVAHYLREFARVLKPGGKIYASFFLYSPEALEAAKTAGTTQWRATFEHRLSEGVYGNDPVYPRGAVAFTDAAMRKVIDAAGLRLARPYLKGSWSGLHREADDGQDVAVLVPA
jgi:ubiquinone/menaquinone biosynthesis C-methylase UbiE